MLTPSPNDLGYLDSALSLGMAAGALLRAGMGRAHEVKSKGTDIDLVTRYDRESEDLIVSGLRTRYPGHRILAEEGGEGPSGDADAPRWIVDPLDGTTNFAHGLPFFSISIACEQGGQVRAGVVTAPALQWTFAAVLGGGATRNGEPIGVSQQTALSRALLVTGFPYDRHKSRENNFAQFVAFQRRAQGVRRIGSAALDLAMVACGWLDGYWEMKLKPWDLAAGLLLVQEAGGRTTNWSGGPADPFGGEVVASNGPLHQQMLEVLSGTQHGVFEG